MSIKLFICYPMNVPEVVIEDLEQEVYDMMVGEEGGDVNMEMFVEKDTYPALKKHMNALGVHTGKVKIFAEVKLTG